MEISAAYPGVPSFADQSHLEFYQRRTSSLPSLSLRPPPLRSVSSVAPLRAIALSDCPPPLLDFAADETCWMKELTELKLQMKQKKKELKSQKKDEKKRMKMQMKEERTATKQKDLVRKKKRHSESSSSSESSDEECMSMSMTMLREECSFRSASLIVPTISEIDGNTISGLIDSGDLPGTGTMKEANHASFELQIPPSVSGSCCNEEAGSLCAETSIRKERAGFQMKCNASNYPIMQAANRIEVCTGGKCKKAGSGQLLSALSMQIPSSSNVVAVPCKCMSQCSMAMNVKVFKEATNPQHHSHVRVEDANIILNNHYGLGRPPSGLPVLEPYDWKRVPASTSI